MTWLGSLKRALHRRIRSGHYARVRSEVRQTPKGTYSLRSFDRLESIFVHVPKTAGVAVADALFGEQPGHYTARYLQTVYGRDFRRYFTFAFVRNPWDRLYSAYRFLLRGGWHPDEGRWADENVRPYRDFSDFVVRGLVRPEVSNHLHFLPQTHFLRGWTGEVDLDFVGRFERLEDDLRLIAARVGRPDARLAKRNAGPPTDFRAVYDRASRECARRVYRDDITLFRYEFGAD